MKMNWMGEFLLRWAKNRLEAVDVVVSGLRRTTLVPSCTDLLACFQFDKHLHHDLDPFSQKVAINTQLLLAQQFHQAHSWFRHLVLS